MGTWKKVVLRGDNATDEQLTLTEAAVNVATDSIAFVDADGSNYIKRDTIVDLANAIAGDALDTDNDGVIDLSVSGLSANSIDDTTNDLVLVWDDNASAWTTASLSDVGSAGSAGVTSITSGNGLTSNSSQTGAVTINLDTSTLSTESVSSTTEFIVSNADTEGVAAASAISLGVFSNSSTNFIALDDLSVGAEGAASGDGSIAYNNTTGVFTYTPPDLSSYLTTDQYASAFSYTGGTTAGPTGTLTVTNGSNVAFGAIPSASSSASGVVTTGAQSFSGNKTFDDNLTVTGDLTVNGTTTTVSTATLTVEDKRIVAAVPDTAAANDATQASNASGGGFALDTHLTAGTDDANYAAVTWSSTGDLTGWRFRDTAGATDFAASVMEFSSDSTAPTGDAGGVGSFHFDSGDDKLYIRVS